MNRATKISLILVESFLYSIGPILIAALTRAQPTRFLGPALVGVGAAVTLFFLELVRERRVPSVSFKSFQASISLALVCYAVPMTVQFTVLGNFSPVFITLMMMSVPLWLWIYELGRGAHRPVYLAVAVAAPLVFQIGMVDSVTLVGKVFLAYLLLLIAVFSFSIGIGFSRRLFWMHSSSSLAFWSILIATGGLIFFAGLHDEIEVLLEMPVTTFFNFIFAGALSIGLGTFCYSYAVFRVSDKLRLFSTLATAMSCFLLTRIFLPKDVVLNAHTLIGWGVAVGCLGLASRTEGSSHWFSLYLSNSIRQGDRVVCDLAGHMRNDSGPVGKIVMKDLSIGGMGFRSDTFFKVADSVLVTIPIGNNWSQMTLDCRIVHLNQVPGDVAFPWLGGLEFKKLDSESMQSLVEFLAKVAKKKSEAMEQAAPAA